MIILNLYLKAVFMSILKSFSKSKYTSIKGVVKVFCITTNKANFYYREKIFVLVKKFSRLKSYVGAFFKRNFLRLCNDFTIPI